MKYLSRTLIGLCLLSIFFVSFKEQNNSGILVKNISEYNDAVSNSKPSDVIKLANGVWKDAELVFEEGTFKLADNS